MTYLGNTPQEQVIFRLEARKSFALALWFKDQTGKPLDLTGSDIRLVVKRLPLDLADSGDSDNLVANGTAILWDPEAGYAGIELQATDLHHPPGEYPFTLVLVTQGYSGVVARGILDLRPNTEFASLGDTYSGVNPPTGLTIALQGHRSLTVRTGPILPPGTVSFTTGDEAKLAGIEPGAQVNQPANWAAGPDDPNGILNKPELGTAAYADVETISVPSGGAPGEVLTKLSASDGHYTWAQPPSGGGGGGGLDATGVPVGYFPAATGVDTWSWTAFPVTVTELNGLSGAVTIDLSAIPDGSSRLAMTPTERSKLAGLGGPPDWDDVTNKPAFGTAALADTSALLAPGGVAASDVSSGVLAAARVPKLGDLRGIAEGTSPPSGGEDGDFYFQYTV